MTGPEGYCWTNRRGCYNLSKYYYHDTHKSKFLLGKFWFIGTKYREETDRGTEKKTAARPGFGSGDVISCDMPF